MQQFLALRALPMTSSASIRCGQVTWEGNFQPTPLSRTYRVRINYRPPRRPRVTVVSPRLEVPRGRHLPHVFPGERLCLCYPEQWSATQPIAHTIVPWASEWLLHYECWLATGDWRGGGHEPKATFRSSRGGEEASA
jgi:hypothetical protein